MAFSPYPRAAYDFSASMETLSTLARDARDGNFTLPHGRGRDKKLQNKIERLAHCVQRGRHILELEKAKPAPARRETPRASGKMRIVMIGGRASVKDPLTAFDWEATQAARDLAKNFPRIAEKITPRATRAEMESLAARFNA